jgi:hypothetical protein
MKAMTPTTSDQDWNAFVTNPAIYADAGRLAACFGDAIAVPSCQLMLDTPRLAPRLSALLASQFGLAPLAGDLAGEDRRIALAPKGDVEDMAMHAGAICWSASLAGTIGKEAVSAIHHQIGEELFDFALANRDIAVPPRPLEPLETLAVRMRDDGWRCIAAWYRTVPEPLSAWLKVKVPVGIDLDAEPMASGAAIVRRASEALQRGRAQ